MVGHGVRTAKGGKNGEAISLFIRQNTGNFGRFGRFSDIGVKNFYLDQFVFLYKFPNLQNRE